MYNTKKGMVYFYIKRLHKCHTLVVAKNKKGSLGISELKIKDHSALPFLSGHMKIKNSNNLKEQALTYFLLDSGAQTIICKLSPLADLGLHPEMVQCTSYNIQSRTSTIKNAIAGKVIFMY